MRLIKIFLIPALFTLLLGTQALEAAEFEVLDKFSVDGYSVLRGSADISGGGFAVGGSTFVVKAGNVGIGTTSPGAKLDVIQALAGKTYGARIVYSGGVASSWYTDGLNISGIGADDNQAFALRTADINRLYISNSGSVGIGTMAPNARLDLGASYGASGEKFLIYNDDTSNALAGTKMGFYLDRFGANNLTLVFPEAPSAPGSLVIAAKDTSGTTINPYITVKGLTGNVGIGTTAPGEKLTITGAGTGYVAGITTDGASQRGLIVRNSQAATTSGGTGPAIILQNTSGTANNFAALAFAGTGTSIGYISGQITDHANSYGNLVFTTRGADGWNDRMTVTSAGNVSIGTLDSNAKLEIAGMGAANATAIRIDSQDTYKRDILFTEFNTTAYGGIIRYDSGGDILQIVTLENSVEKQGIAIARATGNVGIGTTAPSATAKLHVAGDIIGSAQVFRAYLTASFSKAAAWEKLPFNATAYNTLRGTFDTGLNRFTASRAGYYQVSVTGYSSTAGSGSERYGFSVAKNGTPETIAGGNYSAADTPLGGLTMILYLNGSTDYVEIQMYSAIPAILSGGAGQYGMAWFMSYLGS